MPGRDTDLQHLGEDRAETPRAIAPPVYRSSLFSFPDSKSLGEVLRGEKDGYVYTRVANPTIDVLEKKVAALEESAEAIAFSSGMAAVSAVLFSFLRAGDHLVLSASAYGPTLSMARDMIEPLGVEVSLVDPSELVALEDHLRENTRLVYLESPASLTFELTDLGAVAEVARAHSIPTVVDNSWATPIYQKPARLGIDLSLHSGTKYLSGHSDLLLGMVAGSGELIERVRKTAVLLGGCVSPDDALLAVRGPRTLSLRMQRHQDNGLFLSHKLMDHPRVLEVLHPANPFFPGHGIYRSHFSGASGLFSFLLDGEPERFCDALELFLLGVSWGGFESLALPSSVLPEVAKGKGVRLDLPRNLVRLSVGLEDPEDLWEDLQRGFAALD